MNYQEQLREIKKAIDSAKSIAIFLPQNQTIDTTAAALALFLGLQESKKNITIASPNPTRVEFSKLVGVDKITNKVGNKNLVISFDYKEDSIEKVSYNVESDKFNLIIQPREGFGPLQKENVNYYYEGLDAEVIIVIGAQKLENLGSLYEKERQSFNKATTINISATPAGSKFGQINIVEPRGTSTSEIGFNLIKYLSLPLNQDIAGNILKGIEAQTQNLQSPFTTPQTYEVVAELMKAGAKRSSKQPQAARSWAPGQAPSPMVPPRSFQPRTPTQQFPAQAQQPTSTPQSFQPGALQTPATFQPPTAQLTPFPQTQQQTQQQVQQLQQQPPKPQSRKKRRRRSKYKRQGQITPPSRQSNPDSSLTGQDYQVKPQSPQEDWLKPKIYQGKTRV